MKYNMFSLKFSITKILTLIIAFASWSADIQAQGNSPLPDKIFTTVEVMPEPSEDVSKFLAKHVRYPVSAKKNGVEGRVVAQFVITKTGEVDDVKIVRSLDPACDSEVVRILKIMPKWKPGQQTDPSTGKKMPVKVYFTLPVNFKLENNNGSQNTTAFSYNLLDDTLYKPRVLFDGKVKMKIHGAMRPLDAKKIAKLYPDSQPPEYVFSNFNGSVRFALFYLDNAPGSVVDVYDSYLKMLQDAKANIKYSAFDLINDRHYAVFELIKKQKGEDVLVKTAAAIVNGHVFIYSFSCAPDRFDDWKDVCEGSLQSIQLIEE